MLAEKLRSIFIYAGIDRFNYERITPKIYETNRIIITTFSAISTFLLVTFYIMTYFINAMRHNRNVYELGAIFSIALFICARFIAKRYNRVVISLVHIAVAAFYIYGILIGTVVSPEHAAVTFMVMLVFMPMLFIDRPLHAIIASAFYTTIFIFLCYRNKSPMIVSIDIVNVITFSILGMISGVVINHMKLRGYVVEQKLKEISRLDQLTQMNNRNAYELERDLVPSYARHHLTCIYIDVNDLHIMNNTMGHAYGDEMLKFVAEQIKRLFGKEFTYRTGGDEFVAFAPDTGDWEITQKITEMRKVIEEEGYNVAIGADCREVRGIDIEKLVNLAEIQMYRDKDRYKALHGSEKRD